MSDDTILKLPFTSDYLKNRVLRFEYELMKGKLDYDDLLEMIRILTEFSDALEDDLESQYFVNYTNHLRDAYNCLRDYLGES